jgi:serine/threonine-protein kinase
MLTPGTTLGPYQITSSLGAGGMGEVYRASDTRLNRDVALKVLPDSFALDGDRLARIKREAQVVAALNHPNIASIFGLEEIDGRPVLVLELVGGPTLAERIAQGPMPPEEAVPIARQIAEAVEAAHEQGVVHRDLKPANIKLRPDGLVKVLDFGLAKLSDAGAPSVRDQPSMSPTITSPAMTGVGVILGTAAYMAPEQAAGKPADKRADIWSFGVVLWEMLTGERLFAGESTSYILADVLRAPVPLEKIPAGPLRELLQRCLERDVKSRLRDIGEARLVLSRPMVAASVPHVTKRTSGANAAWALAGVLAISAGVALWAPWRAEPERALVRFDVDLGANVTLPPGTTSRNVLISPDGRLLAYVASVGGSKDRLYVRRLDEADEQKAVTALTGTEGAVGAAFSPDSTSLAFVAGSRVYRISVDGGAPLRLSETEVGINNNVAWGDDGSIVVSGLGAGLRRIPPNVSQPVNVTELAAGEAIHAQAHVLPGARFVLFSAGKQTGDTNTIEAVPLAGGARKVIVPSGTAPHYLPTGHLLYLRQGTLFAVRFDPEALVTRGDPVPIVTDVKMTFAGLFAVSTMSVANNGSVIYRKATGTDGIPGPADMRTSKAEWIDSGRRRTPLVAGSGYFLDPRLSPDAERLALTVMGTSGPDVSVYDVRRDSMTRVTSDGLSVNPIWSRPDGRYLVFLKPFGAGGVFWAPALGSGQPERLLEGARELGSFTENGKRLAYTRTDKNRGQIFTVDVTEENGRLKAGTPVPFSPPQSDEFGPEFSNDGRWVAFVKEVSGQRDVWVRAFTPASSTGNGGSVYEVKISGNGGYNPRWSRTRQELLYHGGDQIMAVSYAIAGGMLVPDKPRVHVEKVGFVGRSARPWDLANDGRIAVITPLDPGAPARGEHTVVLLQNFFDEVRRRVK